MQLWITRNGKRMENLKKSLRMLSKIYRLQPSFIKFLNALALPCCYWWTGLTPHPGHEFIMKGQLQSWGLFVHSADSWGDKKKQPWKYSCISLSLIWINCLISRSLSWNGSELNMAAKPEDRRGVKKKKGGNGLQDMVKGIDEWWFGELTSRRGELKAWCNRGHLT